LLYAPAPQQLLATPEQSTAGVHIIGNGGFSWSKSGLAEALAAQGRASLILCGFWLETTVTFLTLPALANGFDVFVLMDITVARSDAARRPAGDRLLQAGVVPVTTHQLIAEWAEQTPDPHVSSSLSSLIAVA
jgi:nicotinamidase-related amidase